MTVYYLSIVCLTRNISICKTLFYDRRLSSSMNWFYGMVPLVYRSFVQKSVGESREDWIEADIDMICSTKDMANYMEQELNKERFTNVPCFFGINCHVQQWKTTRMNSYGTLHGCVVWYDKAGSFVYTEKPASVSTVKIVLHHHYPNGIGSVTTCA